MLNMGRGARGSRGVRRSAPLAPSHLQLPLASAPIHLASICPAACTALKMQGTKGGGAGSCSKKVQKANACSKQLQCPSLCCKGWTHRRKVGYATGRLAVQRTPPQPETICEGIHWPRPACCLRTFQHSPSCSKGQQGPGPALSSLPGACKLPTRTQQLGRLQ